MTKLVGYKTYIIAALTAGVTIAHAGGLIDDTVRDTLFGLLGAGGVATIAAKLNRVEHKTEVIEKKADTINKKVCILLPLMLALSISASEARMGPEQDTDTYQRIRVIQQSFDSQPPPPIQYPTTQEQQYPVRLQQQQPRGRAVPVNPDPQPAPQPVYYQPPPEPEDSGGIEFDIGIGVALTGNSLATFASNDTFGVTRVTQTLDEGPQLFLGIHYDYPVGKMGFGPIIGVFPKIDLGTVSNAESEQPVAGGLGVLMRMPTNFKQHFNLAFMWAITSPVPVMNDQWRDGFQAPRGINGLPLQPEFTQKSVNRFMLVITVSNLFGH